MTAAVREDWPTHPLPDKHVQLEVDWTFSEEQFETMRRGLIPDVMEDKWFVYYDSGWLNFHRSWTGYCIYQARCRQLDSKVLIDKVFVSRDPEQYSVRMDKYDLQLLRYLIDRLLLGKAVDFPQPAEIRSKVTYALLRHHFVGRAFTQEEMDSKHPDVHPF
jgi:hypothetical protein